VIYLTDNHPRSLSDRHQVDADMDPSACCMIFSDDVRSNGECYAAVKIYLLHMTKKTYRLNYFKVYIF
jgi:hypothetical protein